MKNFYQNLLDKLVQNISFISSQDSKNTRSKSVGIIGAGFSGLSAGYYLSQKGYKVSIFELSSEVGGLASAFRKKGWKWPLEKHYHHIFVSDKSIQKLAKLVNHKILSLRPKTSLFYKNRVSQIDDPLSLLKFGGLTLGSRVRTGLVIIMFKLAFFWKIFERYTIYKTLPKLMGTSSWKIIWRPLLIKKFGGYARKIPLSWFWARIKTRSSSLKYPKRGFGRLAESIAKSIRRNGGRIYLNKPIISIKKDKSKVRLASYDGAIFQFDKIICTLPIEIFLKITTNLPRVYVKKYSDLKSVWAINLVLSLKQSFLKDKTYWLNINEVKIPFLCIVEHTNFIDKGRYGGDIILYIGKYLDSSATLMTHSKKEILDYYFPFLVSINPAFDRKWIKNYWVFKSPFAQPIIDRNYSRHLPPLETPIRGIYLCNIQQVYPWDRGTNYSVELGERVANLLHWEFVEER